MSEYEASRMLQQARESHEISWLVPYLVALIVLKTIMVTTCLAVIIIPLCQGTAKRHLWLIRRDYARSGKIPYVLPNKYVAVAISEFTGAILFIIRFSHRIRPDSHQPRRNPAMDIVWFGVCSLPTWLSTWVTGCGLFYTCGGLRRGSRQAQGFLRPWSYNSMWILGCILPPVWVAYWCSRLKAQAVNMGKTVQRLRALENELNNAPLSQERFIDLASQAPTFAHELVTWGKRFQRNFLVWTGGWVALQGALAIFYLFMLQLLVRKIRDVLRKCEAEKFIILNQNDAGSLRAQKEMVLEKSAVPLSLLRQELYFMASYGLSIMLVLLAQFGIACFDYSVAAQADSRSTVKLVPLVAQIPSTLLTPVLLFQCWKSLSKKADMAERKAIEIDQPDQAPDNQTRDFPLPRFYENLFLWYSSGRHDEEECLHIQSADFSRRISMASRPTADPEGHRLELRSIQLSTLHQMEFAKDMEFD